MNAPDVPLSAQVDTAWRDKLATVDERVTSARSLAPMFLLAALACLAFAAGAWPARRRTYFAPPAVRL
jgi:hypothetical protein